VAGAPDKDLRRELRSFGLIVGGMFALIFGLAAPYLKGRPYPRWPWVLCAALAALALVQPMVLKGVHALWTRAGRAMGAINTRIILGLIFYLIVTPLGIVRKMVAGDPMTRERDATASSYRVRKRTPDRRSIEHPY
jgi:hypothetical protein